MEFPIEIQMLIKDYARPMTRPDWRKGSFMIRYYRSEKGKWGQLPIWNFKEYINARRYDKRTNYRNKVREADVEKFTEFFQVQITVFKKKS